MRSVVMGIKGDMVNGRRGKKCGAVRFVDGDGIVMIIASGKERV